MAGDMCENVPLLCCVLTFLQLHWDQYYPSEHSKCWRPFFIGGDLQLKFFLLDVCAPDVTTIRGLKARTWNVICHQITPACCMCDVKLSTTGIVHRKHLEITDQLKQDYPPPIISLRIVWGNLDILLYSNKGRDRIRIRYTLRSESLTWNI